MCGITAIISRNQTNKKSDVFKFLFGSLTQLQNRGYDSAGICGVNEYNKFVVHKKASDETQTALEKIKEEGQYSFDSCFMGIAHTRWATHGEKNDVNSHPHICYRNKVALVHNGIIENYDVLKKDLMKKGITFKSQTDSEVVVNLISYYYTQMNLLDAINKACGVLQGTWALAIISVDSDKLYFTRHGSPLIMAQTENDVVITSELSGLMSNVKDFNKYTLVKELTVYQMTPDSIIDCETKDVHFETCGVTPYPYPHWTLKEINEQADSIKRALNYGGRITADNKIRLGGLDTIKEALIRCNRVILVGCGTSFHSGIVGQHYMKQLRVFKSVQCINAAEFDEETIQSDYAETLVIFLSQSGETRDVIKCLEICKKLNILTMGVVNVVNSYIANETDCGVYLNAGREVGVASTKSFTSQVIVLVLITLWFHQYKHSQDMHIRIKLLEELKSFADNTTEVLNNIQSYNFNEIVKSFQSNSMFVLGTKGKDMAVALEGALKIKEISYVHCEGSYTASLKHGPLALISKNTPVIYLISKDTDESTVFNAVEEVRSRGGTPYIVGNHENADIPIMSNNEFSFLWNNIVLQILAYYMSVSKNINPDMPRNLAKVVTVG